MILFVIFCFFSFSIFSEEIFNCSTEKHIGLNFIGRDYNEILSYLGLKDFEIKLSRKRQDIFIQEKKNLELKVLTKTSHFIEIVILKSSGHAIPLHCSWFFDIRKDNLKEKDFNCVGYPENNRIFSLDFHGNFMYSSKFESIIKKDNKTLHSLIGKCSKTSE